MSVIMLDKKELAELGMTILANERLGEVFPSAYERLEQYRLGGTGDRRNKVMCFTDRLYIANQVAYYYNYPDTCQEGRMVIQRLDEEDFSGVQPASLRKFVERARCVRYNLYTNSGRAFLYEEGMSRLERLLDAAMCLIIEEIEEGIELENDKEFGALRGEAPYLNKGKG